MQYFTMVEQVSTIVEILRRRKTKRFPTKLYVDSPRSISFLQLYLSPKMKPKILENSNSRHASIDAIFHEFTRHVGEEEEGRREERTKDLVCILNVDFNYKHRVRDIIFAGKNAGEGKKLAIAYCRAPTTIPHPEYLKRNPSLNCKANQNDTVQPLLLPLHPFPYFHHPTPRDFLPFLISRRRTRRRRNLLDWILIRAYQQRAIYIYIFCRF